MDQWSGFDEIFGKKTQKNSSINYDGLFYNKFLDNLREKATKFGNQTYFDMISQNIDRIYENLEVNKKIIAIGEVQSGKTENIIGTLNLALDNNWDIIIVMGGTTNLLFTQFQERFEKNIPDKNDVIFYKFNPNSASMNLLVSQGKKIIISIVKNATKIEKIYEEIKNSEKGNRILIIDDECDYMSLNVGVKKDSKIYSFIKKIMEFRNSKYIGITATPYGNLVSYKSEAIYPDTVVKLNCDKDVYTGLEFFQKAKVYELTDNFKKDENLNTLLYNFVLDFVFKSTVSSILGLDFTRGLINISLETENQNEISNLILEKIYSSVFYDLRDFKIDIDSKLKEISPFLNISKEQFKEQLKNLFREEKFKVQPINGRTKYVEKRKLFIILVGGNLISRGITFENLVSEVMINVRDKKQPVDTLLQRARWFGYRKNGFPNSQTDLYFFNLMKVFINEPVGKALEEAQQLNNYLYNDLIENNVCKEPNILTDWLLKYRDSLELISYSDKE